MDSAYGAVTRSGPPFQASSAIQPQSVSTALQPRARRNARGLGYSPFARRYSGSHCCFPFLRLLRCFSSSGWPPYQDDRPPAGRVPPFGHPRINGCSRLPAAYRSLPRPSSPPGAKASPVRLTVLVAYRARPAASLSGLVRDYMSILALSLELVLIVVTFVCLSFHPVKEPVPNHKGREEVVPGRLELPTPTLSVWCSNRTELQDSIYLSQQVRDVSRFEG